MKASRFLYLLLALCLVVSLAPGVRAETADDAKLEQALIEACQYRQTCDLSEFNMTIEELKPVFFRLLNSGKLPSYVSNDLHYSYNPDTMKVVSFTPKAEPADENAISTYEEAIAQVLDKCVFDGMQDWQIALSIHDYLITHSVYDESLVKNTAYSLLVEGTSVCAGYARAYQELMTRAGIECLYVSSEKMNHAWNLVKIDGKWYHVDVTWDDPSPNIAGFARHTYFLATDEEMASGDKPHYDWETDITCTDTRFSQSFWREVKSPIIYENSDVCYLVRVDEHMSHIYRREEAANKETLIYKEEKYSLDIGHGTYLYEHHGLTLREGRLWFGSMSKVLSVKTDGSDLQTHYTNTGNTYIYGCFAGENALELTLNDHDGKGTAHSVPLTPTADHKCTFTRTVTEPTQTEAGYTLSKCSCGLEAKSLSTAPSQWALENIDSPTAGSAAEEKNDRKFVLTGIVVAFILIRLFFRLFKKKK
ncbi:MAG: hypothetical protein IKA47_11085 [Oscillospiraceae bacterium]|nr:hypothetical protein [Oscillospiraceae bacterium]